jgi:hypothetical protein
LKDGKKMNKIIPLLIALVISFVFVPEASASEYWYLSLDAIYGSQGGPGTALLTEGQNGTITSDGEWYYNYEGANVHGSYSNAPVTIAGLSISITASGTAYNPIAPQDYQYSTYTLIITGKAYRGHASGTFTMTFETPYWPQSINSTWTGTRGSGSGITADKLAMPWIPLLLHDD